MKRFDLTECFGSPHLKVGSQRFNERIRKGGKRIGDECAGRDCAGANRRRVRH